jgi:predicted permease
VSWRRRLRRKYWDAERAEEMQSFLEHETRDNLARGMSAEEARRQAYLAFGNPQKIREEIWRMNSIEPLQKFLTDLRYAWRSLRHNPGYAGLAILTLGLGIGANTAIFTVINGVLLRPLPYAAQGRIVHMVQTEQRTGTQDLGLSVPAYFDFRSQTRSFSDFAEYHSMLFTLLGTKTPQRVVTGVVSSQFFDVLGVKPQLGRLFSPDDDSRNAPAVLVLSNAFWRKQFGGDRSVIGRTFEMNDRVHTVIGVLPPLPDYPDANDIYMPVSSCPYRMDPMMIQSRDMRMITAYGRLRPGVSLRQADAELAAIEARMAHAWPQSYAGWRDFSVHAAPVKQELTHAARPTFLALLGASLLVLLLACVNLANLALSRQLRRSRETAIRLATGASRWDVIRPLLAESVLVALAGAGIGIAIAAAGSRLLETWAARLTPLSGAIHPDLQVVLFGVGSSLLAGLLFAILPSILASRTPLTAVRDGGERAAGTEGGTRTRNLLVTLQVALSFVLLTAAGLMMRSVYNLLSVDPGFQPARVLSMQLDLNWTKYKKPTDQLEFFHRILNRAEATPGVQAASISWMAPLNPDMSAVSGPVRIEGQPLRTGEPAPTVDFETASPDYFRVLGIPTLAGRTFLESDGPKTPLVIVINASMARHYWPHQNPIGHRIQPAQSDKWWTVVGVVGDVREYGLDQPPADTLYVALDQNPIQNAHLMVKTRNAPLLLANIMAATIHQIDPEQPVTQIRTLEQMRAAQVGIPRVTATLLSLFAIVALFITIVGASGTMALTVAQRSREIGIRVALGATRHNILQVVLRQGMTPVLAGLALGALFSLFATRAMAHMIFRLSPDDPVTFAGIAALFFAVALVSCSVPARRAMAIDPMETLRNQ